MVYRDGWQFWLKYDDEGWKRIKYSARVRDFGGMSNYDILKTLWDKGDFQDWRTHDDRRWNRDDEWYHNAIHTRDPVALEHVVTRRDNGEVFVIWISEVTDELQRFDWKYWIEYVDDNGFTRTKFSRKIEGIQGNDAYTVLKRVWDKGWIEDSHQPDIFGRRFTRDDEWYHNALHTKEAGPLSHVIDIRSDDEARVIFISDGYSDMYLGDWVFWTEYADSDGKLRRKYTNRIYNNAGLSLYQNLYVAWNKGLVTDNIGKYTRDDEWFHNALHTKKPEDLAHVIDQRENGEFYLTWISDPYGDAVIEIPKRKPGEYDLPDITVPELSLDIFKITLFVIYLLLLFNKDDPVDLEWLKYIMMSVGLYGMYITLI